MRSGTARRVNCNFAEFAKLLSNAKSSEAFAYGVHSSEYGDSVSITVASRADKSNKILARTDEFYQFQNDIGIMMLDHDECGSAGERLAPEEFMNILATIYPGIEYAAYIVKGSSSSGIHRSHEQPKAKGFHVYFLVHDAADIPRFGSLLNDRLWLAGYGHISLAANGNMLIRTISDRAVHQGSRLDFVGRPVIEGSGLSWSEPEMRFKMGNILDTSLFINLSDNEQKKLQKMQVDAKALAKPYADDKAVIYIDKRVTEMMAKGVDEISAKTNMAQINHAGHKKISGYFPLFFDTLGEISVREVLANPQKFHLQSLADPVEGVTYGTGTAMMFVNDDHPPFIHSFAHGKSTYTLHQPDEIALFPDIDERPCYRVYSQETLNGNIYHLPGVYFHDLKPGTAKKGPFLIDKRICGELYVDAITHDYNGFNFGYVLRFINSIGDVKHWDMPAHMLAGRNDEMLKALFGMGLHITYEYRQEIAVYICSVKPKEHIMMTQQVGWHDDSFVLPKQVFGEQKVIFRAETGGHEEYSSSGTSEEWRSHIAKKCIDNPLLLLVISTAFAGPLLRFRAIDGAGVHIYGQSSCGKTTILKAAASVWGHPQYYIRPWKSTANGLEGHACLYNDGCLILDEISEADPREIDRSIYSLANGRGKLRAVETGSARVTKKWRIMVLSNGEKKLADHLSESKLTAKAGQLVRLIEIPVSGPFRGPETPVFTG